jgi:ribosome recycling factor
MAEEQDIELIFMDAEDRMEKSVAFFRTEVDGIRTGRADPSMLETVKIELYGTTMQLNQVATITAPDSRLLAVQPFDRSSVGAIERELRKSDLGFSPNSDGTIIRLPLPLMTQERRQTMVRRLKRLQEDAHVAVRNVRRDIVEQFRGLEKAKSISQDELHTYQDHLQKLTDEYVAAAAAVAARKEAELAEV